MKPLSPKVTEITVDVCVSYERLKTKISINLVFIPLHPLSLSLAHAHAQNTYTDGAAVCCFVSIPSGVGELETSVCGHAFLFVRSQVCGV